jgi:hypothetical protein
MYKNYDLPDIVVNSNGIIVVNCEVINADHSLGFPEYIIVL